MNKNNNDGWNTKYGPRRVRHEAPTLEEAIIAAQGLSDEIDEQAEIAASLMGLPRDQVRAELLKLAPPKSTRSVLRSRRVRGSRIRAARRHGRAQEDPPRDHRERSRRLGCIEVRRAGA